MKNLDDRRREFLLSALSAGLYATGSMGILQPVWAMGKIPKQLVPGKSIYDLSGDVRVDGVPATEETLINVNSTVKTGDGSHVIFAVGKDAFVLRSNSSVKVEGSSIISQIRLISGKLLSVFGKRVEKQTLSLHTTTATIGIRGTGVYLEAEEKQTYVCTCYGTAELSANEDSKSVERVETRHHDAPRFILADQSVGKNIQPAPVFNHTDDELALVETLVGRVVPFSGGAYSSPRKTTY
ncbi:MAG: hypothetical protein DIZ80_08830 [endosymbiont of Galathealinum brachiosum]|uniref:FecR protein domain-containing protein n=1 Tax=endosymbiont of Galathealinum brachiosum TaxID=2200906 RepID=A0A370DBV5_9GAMM|nr:MAG: hypothetical protein DIZ80_08830 [endosymbiont of Galathealinum brachiosum]